MNAPERIWASNHIGSNCVVSFFTPSEHYSTEYIRADVAADMVAAALREAARVALNACLVPPDGGTPTEEEATMCQIAAEAILALIPCKDTAELALGKDDAK